MMLSPESDALFVEVCKTGSTAAATHLRDNGWRQNGSGGMRRIPGTAPGRHAFLEDDSILWCVQQGIATYGVVRNPWDRMASLWRASAPDTEDFWTYMTRGRFKHGGVDVLRFPQVKWLRGVDNVLRYETLVADWTVKAAELGHLPPLKPRGLPVVNRSKKRAKPEWTDREIELIAERFADDIAAFGYEGPS